jgi:Domain of unknown function (DUF2024)
MKVAVWDTYVKKKDDHVMHFDILVPDWLVDEAVIYAFGKQFLKLKNQPEQPLTVNECHYCHIEEANETVLNDIITNGFSIIEMEGCN